MIRVVTSDYGIAMGQKLFSLLLALLIYAGLVFAAVYSYTQYRSQLLAAQEKRPESIALTLAGSKHPKKISNEEISHPQEKVSPAVQKPPVKQTENKPVPKKNTEAKRALQPAQKNKAAATPAPAPETKQSAVAVSAAPDHIPSPRKIPALLPQKPSPPAASPSRTTSGISNTVHTLDPQKTLALKHLPVHRKQKRSKQKLRKKGAKKYKKQRRHSGRTQRKKGTQGSHLKRSGNIGKNRFLAQLKAKINRHKRYPRVARRKGLKGTVRVSFTLLKSGRVGAIRVRGTPAFYRATREAVRSAFPIDPAAAPFSLPRRITLSMRYR